MKDKLQAMVFASFAADALAMGVHWVYNTHAIDLKHGRVETYVAPMASYHKPKQAGEFTHYGDQTLILLETVGKPSGFNLPDFANAWRKLFENYGGYFDKATKGTLENFASGAGPESSGSPMDDLSGASRIAPVIWRHPEELGKSVRFSREQTAMTHNDARVVDAAGFLAEVVHEVLNGKTPCSAFRTVADRDAYKGPIRNWVSDGLESAESDTRTTISDFGQMCEIGAAFPATVHLIAKYENDLREALIQNVMAGGDSAARGLIVGMVLGAHLGLDAIPKQWLDAMKAFGNIKRILNQK